MGGGGYNWYVKNATMRVYGAWVKIYRVLCSKTYSTSGSLLLLPSGSRQAAGGVQICATPLST